MTELPDGWVNTNLGEICERISDGSHNPPKKQSTGFPMLSAININANSIRFDNYRLISEAEFEIEDRRTQVRADDVLLTIVGAIGRAAVVPKSAQKFTLQRSVAVLRSVAMPPRLLMYHLEEPTTAKFFKENARGTAQKGIYLRTLSSTPINLPPLNEQRRIVERIEAMFEEIDAGTESLRAAQAKLGLYRQSLLKSAFEGRLTADWRAQNADKLEAPETLLSRIGAERDTRFKSALNDWQKALTLWREDGEQGKKPAKPKRLAEFAFQEDKPEGPWPTVKVQTLLGATLINGRSVKDKAGGFPVLRLTSLKNGQILLSESKEGDWSEAEAQPFLVKRDDIFLARGNGSKKLVGIAGRVMQTPMPVAFPDTMIRVRLDTSAVRPDFFLLAWNSWTVRSQIESAARTTAGIYKINQDHVSGFAFPLPSVAEQAEIVRILDAKLEAADALEAEITAALTRADALRQSILKKAFSGRLVPQDPTDEPASVLLDRIQATRAAAPKAKRKRKTSA